MAAAPPLDLDQGQPRRQRNFIPLPGGGSIFLDNYTPVVGRPYQTYIVRCGRDGHGPKCEKKKVVPHTADPNVPDLAPLT